MDFQAEIKENGRKNTFRDKKTRKKVGLRLKILKFLRKFSNCVFGLCQNTSQAQYMYLPFKNLKIISKKPQEWYKGKRKLRTIFLDVKIQIGGAADATTT